LSGSKPGPEIKHKGTPPPGQVELLRMHARATTKIGWRLPDGDVIELAEISDLDQHLWAGPPEVTVDWDEVRRVLGDDL